MRSALKAKFESISPLIGELMELLEYRIAVNENGLALAQLKPVCCMLVDGIIPAIFIY